MHKSGSPVHLWSAISMGIGAMVGAGIFALLGEAGSIAGNQAYLSFLIGGLIALLSGYSFGKLGAQYPAAGGIIEYLTQGFGAGTFTGGIGIILYFAALVSLSLISKAFANYFLALFKITPSFWAIGLLSATIIALFVFINLNGAKDVAFWEALIVFIKFSVLVILSIAGVVYLNPDFIKPTPNIHTSNILSSLAITFFAYEGFRVVSNTAEDMKNPQSTLPKAILISILLVMLLYLSVSIAVFGNLPVQDIIDAKDYALAKAAVPVFGQTGFTIVSITALLSTASAINANLYAVTNVTYQLAKDGELPREFSKQVAKSREGLIISGVLVIILSLLFNLSEIASIGSILVLFVHGITHLGHLRIIKLTKASTTLVILAMSACFLAMILALIYLSHKMAHTFIYLISFICVAYLLEIILQRFGKKYYSR